VNKTPGHPAGQGTVTAGLVQGLSSGPAGYGCCAFSFEQSPGGQAGPVCAGRAGACSTSAHFVSCEQGARVAIRPEPGPFAGTPVQVPFQWPQQDRLGGAVRGWADQGFSPRVGARLCWQQLCS